MLDFCLTRYRHVIVFKNKMMNNFKGKIITSVVSIDGFIFKEECVKIYSKSKVFVTLDKSQIRVLWVGTNL